MSIGTYPKHIMTERQLCDLALLLEGAFNPLKSFVNEVDYLSILEKGRLENGKIWPIPVILDLDPVEGYQNKDKALLSNKNEVKVGDSINLSDVYATIYATLTIKGMYDAQKSLEAKQIYGTDSIEHPGVNYLIKKTKNRYVYGDLKQIRPIEWYDFDHLRLSRKELVAKFKKMGKPVIAFQTRNPIHKSHASLIARSAMEVKGSGKNGAHIFINPVVGPTKPGDIEYRIRVKTYEAVLKEFKNATLSIIPIAMRMAGPKEAIWHALIRKNYGATHFIVGRDHAGPGNNSKGEPFYGPYEAQQALLAVAPEIGIVAVPSKEIVFVEKLNKYMPVDEVPKNIKHSQLSGTEVRKILREGKELPEWFTFPDVKKVLQQSVTSKRGLVILFTGISGVGKTTLAKKLAHYIDYNYGKYVSVLDGDEVRGWLSEGLGFSENDRKKNIMRVGKVALEITRHGGTAICSLIAPYADVRNDIREMIKPHADFFEIYVHAPLGVVKKRDMKGLYDRSKKDKTIKMSGVDDVYEIPKTPDIDIDSSRVSVEQAIKLIVKKIEPILRNQ